MKTTGSVAENYWQWMIVCNQKVSKEGTAGVHKPKMIIIIIKNECHSNIIDDRLQGCSHSKKLQETSSLADDDERRRCR